MRSFFVGGMLLLLAISVANVRGALLFPYLNPIRSVLVTNIAVVTNTSDLSR